MIDDKLIITSTDNVDIDLNDYLADTINLDNIICSDTTDLSIVSINPEDLYIYDDITIVSNTPVEFEDIMPDVAKVEDMCNDYPALEKAYENFKTIYKLVHQDWKGRQDADK